ncbi:fimbrial protein [Herbaspirillum robiniae]|uniref:fimbrial protein n=1 Tax=Herbaspirillum robiniae TaxID=2014887 RepID=UPI003D783041
MTSAVYATVSDPRDSSNRSDRLSLTASSSARGVAVQILREGTPINFGLDSAARGNANQFKLFDANASQPRFTAAFQARYLQTAATVTPGTANSVVTMTMSYQ